MKVIILKQHNGEYQGWHEIDSSKLQEWLDDGGLEEGDRVVYPKKIMKTYKEEEFYLKEVTDTD